jgi:imidazole glycerol-phosphate synthase subunit HisH
VTRDPRAIVEAPGVVLPGVGAFGACMRNLESYGLDAAVRRVLDDARPFLGICLGMQLLFEESDEFGPVRGLGALRGRVERFPERAPDGSRRLVPHIGWNEVRWQREGARHPMLDALPERDHYYFVHSYRALPSDAGSVVGTADYGGAFAAAVARDNVFAVQFHPEKSQAAGKRLLDAFAAWVASCR